MNFPDSFLAVGNIPMLCVYSTEMLLNVSLKPVIERVSFQNTQ